MSFRVVTSPWAMFSGEEGVDLRSDDAVLRTAGVMPRLIGPDPRGLTWNKGRPVLASWCGDDQDSQWDLPLLTTAGVQSIHAVRSRCEVTQVELEGLPDRSPEALRDTDNREQWLLWQLQRYAELASMDISMSEIHDLEAKLPFGARRSWRTVAGLLQMGGDESAELSLIVRFAKRTRLLHALRAIERGPRTVLERKHTRQKISRVQEMDSTTLRAYSRAPGRSAAEKAGSEQELLAVVRADTVDLAENRVLFWCARRMARMAAAYCQRNRAWAGSQRVTLVRQLGRLCRQVLTSPRLEGVRELPHHLSTPTYCLQFEPRYRKVWRAYRELRRQERLVDDAWRWHPHLWGTTARLLMASMLSELEGWHEIGLSTPYFRTEGMCGEWTCGPSTPGPFASPFGKCEVFDFRDRSSAEALRMCGVPEAVLRSGADWALAWPESKRLALAWTAVASVDTATELETHHLSARLRAVNASGRWTCWGLILLAEPAVDAAASDWVAARDNLTVLRFPEDIHLHWSDLCAGLELGIGELHGA